MHYLKDLGVFVLHTTHVMFGLLALIALVALLVDIAMHLAPYLTRGRVKTMVCALIVTAAIGYQFRDAKGDPWVALTVILAGLLALLKA